MTEIAAACKGASTSFHLYKITGHPQREKPQTTDGQKKIEILLWLKNTTNTAFDITVNSPVSPNCMRLTENSLRSALAA